MSTPASSQIPEKAQTGFAKSAAYDQYRPSYSASATQELLDKLGVAGVKHAKILDLAAGTGKFTEVLVAREEQYEIIAVEPLRGMRDHMTAKKLPGVDIKAGKADSIPLEDESVDAVVAAQHKGKVWTFAKRTPAESLQAFHWFANMPALREIHRVLRPHGALGMIWNIEDYNAPRSHKAATDWEAKAQELTWTFFDKEPRFRHGQWREVFDDQVKSTPLSMFIASEQFFSLPIGEYQERFEVWLAKEKIWARYNTISHVSVLEGEQRERTKKTFMDALNGPEVKTNEKGEVCVHGNTYVYWTSKIPQDGRESLTGVERPGA